MMFLMVKTRLEIVFPNFVVRRFTKNLGYEYIKSLKTILHYLKGLKQQEITYKAQNKLKKNRYFNCNWAKNKKS